MQERTNQENSIYIDDFTLPLQNKLLLKIHKIFNLLFQLFGNSEQLNSFQVHSLQI